MTSINLATALAALALTACASGSVAPSPPPVELTITPVHDARGFAALNVQLTFVGEADGETELALPDEWGGQRELYKAIRNLVADNASISPGATPASRILRHAPNARIVLSYRVVEDAEGPAEGGNGNDYRVRMRSDYFFAIGDTFVVQPANISADTTAHFVIVDAPAAFASDLEHQAFGRALDFGDLIESVMIGGAIRVIDAGGGARLALHGAVDARNDQGWRDAFVRISSAQHAYWGASDEPFLVTVLAEAPVDAGSISIGGTGRTDAFAFFATSNAIPETIDRIMAHEMMHTWTPRRIGGLRTVPSEAQDYWLSEGFTDWTSWRVLARGEWTPAAFAEAFNEQIKAYDLSPVREAPNARIIADFWNDGDVDKLPYQRGMLLASYWDWRVRTATQSASDFDDVLFAMQARARNESETPAVTLLIDAMRDVAGIDITPELERHVERGEAVTLPSDLFGPCGTLTWVERATFHRGFDLAATQAHDNTITGVIVNGPAWRAGLRDGMHLVRRSGGEIGNSDVEIAYDVLAGGQPRTLRWLPRGDGQERFREFELVSELRGDALTACRNRLGGQ